MGEMGIPTLNGLLNGDEWCGWVRFLEVFDADTGAAEIAVADANPIGEDAKADEVATCAGLEDLAFDGMDF